MHKSPRIASLGVLGHAERRAIKARTMGRAQWRHLSQRLRAASRNAGTYSLAARPRELLIELQTMTGCEVGRWPAAGARDVLAGREWGLHAFSKGTQAERDACGPIDCCGIKGALRVQLAVQWYPLLQRAVQTSALGSRA